MPDYKLLGHNYTTPDLIAKVTGRAKYAEDYRTDGMSFCKLLLSPMPHCRVRRIDAGAALAMPGVKGMLTADDLPAPPKEGGGSEAGPSPAPEVALTNEPVYQGEPILAVAAVSELAAAEAIEKITLDLEPLPFVIDPLESLRPNGPNARREGNAFVGGKLKTLKWTSQDFAGAPEGQMPTGEPGVRWAYGDLSAGFQQAALVLDDTFHTQTTSHQPLETRSAMAYWQNGKLHLHCSTQSVMRTVESVARWVGITPEQIVVISEYTGGGFGSKIPGTHTVAVPALLARRSAGRRPVRRSIRSRSGADDVLARLPADGDAFPWSVRADQHAAADIATGARRRTDERHHGTAARQGGASARDRSGRAPSHQCAVRQGAVRRPRQGRQAQPRHQRIRAASDRSWSRALPVERTKNAQR